MDGKRININDVAKELGMSKSTVSRAISGKGRISEQTRVRVMDYINQIGYVPNNLAKSLAQSRTNNIACVIPKEDRFAQLPFFQKFIWGINNSAVNNDYDVLTVIATKDDISQLERVIKNQKVDGVILARLYENDMALQFLKENEIPFVAIGTVDDSNVVQIDNDNMGGCRELTSDLLNKGYERIAYIGNNELSTVNNQRLMGYVQAFLDADVDCPTQYISLMDNVIKAVDTAVEKFIEEGVDCIVCMDDAICADVLEIVEQRGLSIPKDISVASLYDSSVLERNRPGVTTLSFDAEQLGEKGCQILIDEINGKNSQQKYLQDYSVVWKGSTR